MSHKRAGVPSKTAKCASLLLGTKPNDTMVTLGK